MTVRLGEALNLDTLTVDEIELLAQLPAGILNAHGRRFVEHLLFRFDPEAPAEARNFVRQVAAADFGVLTSAAEQLAQIAAFKVDAASTDREVVGMLAISATGFDVLRPGLPLATAGFRNGANKLREYFGPQDMESWDWAWRLGVDLLIVLAGDDADAVRSVRNKVLAIAPRASHIGSESGVVLCNEDGHVVEHFGFRENLSTPELTTRSDRVPQRRWDYRLPIGHVLAPMPVQADGEPGCAGFGSYVVFAKLEQNVRAFWAFEHEMESASARPAPGLAAASIIGRFRDGTPLTRSGVPNATADNDFVYRNEDDNGNRCPVSAHIRAVNLRDDPDARRIVRRGITYGTRSDAGVSDPGVPPERRPAGGVGILFTSVHCNVHDQFEWVLENWVKNDGYTTRPFARDSLIGPRDVASMDWPKVWGSPPEPGVARRWTPPKFVTLRGGGYFFAPPLGFLRKLGA